MLNDNYLEVKPVKADSVKCKDNPDKCCVESNINGATAKFGFMCKSDTCNKRTGICDLGSAKEAFSSAIGSLYEKSNLVEGFTIDGVSSTTIILFLAACALLYLVVTTR